MYNAKMLLQLFPYEINPFKFTNILILSFTIVLMLRCVWKKQYETSLTYLVIVMYITITIFAQSYDEGYFSRVGWAQIVIGVR